MIESSGPRVIVTVHRTGTERSCDLELASDIPLGELTPVIGRALNWPDPAAGSYAVTASPPRRALKPEHSLAESQCWDGTSLWFEPVTSSHVRRGPAGT